MELTRLDLTQLPGRERNPGWRVNQELLATVVGRAKDGAGYLLRINGQLYQSGSKAPLQQGNALIVRVAAMSPQLELEIVEMLRAPNNQQQPAAVVSGHLLEQAKRLRQNSLSNLAQLPYQHNQTELQSLPGDSMILLNKLKRSMYRPGDLARLDKLRAALDNSGVFLESKLLAAATGGETGDKVFENDLKALLLRLVNSLGGGGGFRHQTSGTGSEPYGLSLYRELYHQPTGLKKRVINHAEEILKKIVDTQYRAIDESDEGWQRWVFDLPLYNNAQPESIPLIIHGEKQGDEEELLAQRWGAEFSLHLNNGGQVKTRINLMAASLRIEFFCEQEFLAEKLQLGQDRLRRKLAAGGLNLDKFSSRVH